LYLYPLALVCGLLWLVICHDAQQIEREREWI
jgi:hypothetical protein